MKILLKNVNLQNPAENLNKNNSDILIENGIVKKINELSEDDIAGAEVFELENKYLVPGFFDMHVHLREPGRENAETIQTGCKSAAEGGFTGIACMPNTDPAIDKAEIITFIKKKSTDYLTEVFPVAAATVARAGEILSPMAELAEAGAVAFSDDGVAIKNSAILRRALEYSQMYSLPIIEHCEDESLANGAMNEGFNSTLLGLSPLPSVSEDIIVIRDILMAEYTGGKLHIAHISTKNAVDFVRQAKKKGINVTAEVTPHHFTLTDNELKTYDTNYKMNPPLRSEEDVNAIIEGLKDGTIDCIASDHAPHSIEEKEKEFEFAPNGIIGLETTIGLSLTALYHKGILNLDDLIFKLSINPRKVLNLPIPSFKIGAKANFTLLSLDEVWKVDVNKFFSKSKNSPFHNKLLTGKAIGVINGKKYLIH